jgi:Myc amino-terminal region.
MVIQEETTNTSNWSSSIAIREMNEYSEDIVSAKTLLYDSNPNDDMWRKFALPLTPPSSPSRSSGESSECSDTTQDISTRLQDVCDSLDSAFDIRNCVLPDAKYLRSKLISDCMWSGNHGTESKDETRNDSLTLTHQPKLSIDTEEDLYPTPCASPIPNTAENGTDYPSSTDCVDPTTVFPLPPSQDSLPAMLSAQSDSGKFYQKFVLIHESVCRMG